jgi:hypothetical protein
MDPYLSKNVYDLSAELDKETRLKWEFMMSTRR